MVQFARQVSAANYHIVSCGLRRSKSFNRCPDVRGGRERQSIIRCERDGESDSSWLRLSSERNPRDSVGFRSRERERDRGKTEGHGVNKYKSKDAVVLGKCTRDT